MSSFTPSVKVVSIQFFYSPYRYFSIALKVVFSLSDRRFKKNRCYYDNNKQKTSLHIIFIILSEQGREPTTNSTHICSRSRDLNSGHTSGRRALSPLCHPCRPIDVDRSKTLLLKLPIYLVNSYYFNCFFFPNYLVYSRLIYCNLV